MAYKIFEESEEAKMTKESQGLKRENLLPITVNEVESENERNRIAEILERLAAELKQPSNANSPYQENDKTDEVYQKRKRKIPKVVSENIFIITFVWQFLCVLGLEAIDALMKHKTKKREKPWFIGAVVIMVMSQLANLILCLSVTLKLFKQYKHKTVVMRFLFHSFIATIFLFAGMYTLTAWILPKAFTGGVMEHQDSKIRALYLYSKLIFVSISTGTLCGAAHVVASHVVSELMMSFQMLLSFLYFASLMSEVVNPTAPPSPTPLSPTPLSTTDAYSVNQREGERGDAMA